MANRLNIDESQIDNTIWRYTNFAKFVDLLETKALFFANRKSFPDQYEGWHNALGANDHFDISNEGKLVDAPEPYDQRSARNSKGIKQIMGYHNDMILRSTGIQCWAMKQKDSNVMWKAYAGLSSAVAITSTPRRLLSSLKQNDTHQITYGLVDYIDYEKEKIPPDNIYSPLFKKADFFCEENEFRVCVTCKDDEQYIPQGDGFPVIVDLKRLITGVYISPMSQGWFSNLCAQICKRYGVDAPVRFSKIFSVPPGR